MTVTRFLFLFLFFWIIKDLAWILSTVLSSFKILFLDTNKVSQPHEFCPSNLYYRKHSYTYNVKADLPSMTAMRKHIKETFVASFIFKCHFLDSQEWGIWFHDFTLQPVYVWWKNLFSIFTAVSPNILGQRVLDLLPGNLHNICWRCQIAENSHIFSQYGSLVLFILYPMCRFWK